MNSPYGEVADPNKLLAVISQLTQHTPKETLINLCNAIAALPDFNDVLACVQALSAQTGKTPVHLVTLSHALGERLTEWELAKAGQEANALFADIKAIGKDGPPTDAQRAELCQRIAALPGETERQYLIHALARRLKSNPRFIAKMVAEFRGESTDETERSETQLVQKVLDITGSGAPPELRLPENYTITKTGAILRLTQDGSTDVSPVPILLTQIFEYPGTETVRYRVAFRLHNAATGDFEWHSITADPSRLFDDRKIMGLTNYRLPVRPDYAKEVASWLSALAGANHGILPQVQGIPVAGWYWPGMKVDEGGSWDGGGAAGDDLPDLDRAVFLWGRQCITRDGVAQGDMIRLEASEGDAMALRDAMYQRGSFQEWLDATWPLVMDRPVARVRLYASLASPLVRLCGGGGHVNHNGGHTTLGKTVVAQWAMSPWGNPGGPGMPDGPCLMRSWDMTKVGAERTFGFLNDIPAYLDDDPRTRGGQDQANQQRVQDIVMTLANGVGRVRGAPDSRILVTRHWHLNVISTSEQAIRDIVGRDGAMVRVVDLWGSPLVRVEGGREVAEREEALRAVGDALRAAAARNFGWGPEYIQAVMSYSRSQLLETLEGVKEDLPKSLKAAGVDIGRLEARQMGYWALMMVAAAIFHLKLCKGHPLAGGAKALAEASEAVQWVIQQTMRANPMRQVDEEVYDQVLAWAVAFKDSFYGHWEGEEDDTHTSRRAPPGGWYGKWRVTVTAGGGKVQCVAIMPHRFNEVVSRLGQSPETILRLWADKGLIVTQNGKRTRVLSLDNWKEGVRMVCVVWKERTADDGGGDQEGEDPPRF